MSGMTIEDFIVQAGQLGVQKGIEHCHITLRPLAKSLDGIDNSLANDENASKYDIYFMMIMFYF